MDDQSSCVEMSVTMLVHLPYLLEGINKLTKAFLFRDQSLNRGLIRDLCLTPINLSLQTMAGTKRYLKSPLQNLPELDPKNS